MPATPPNVLNYYIGKGSVFVKLPADVDYRHVGNVSEFEFTPAVEKLDHFSQMSGVRTKDRTVVLEKSATLRMVMEEWVAENLALAVLGEVDTNTAGDEVINIFSLSEITAAVKFVGANDIGNQIDIELPTVSFQPGASLTPISDEWGGIEVQGDVLDQGQGFGTITVRDENTSASPGP
jgi:hypothetical protein